MQGKLFIIDGVDSSGKETNCNLLYRRLSSDGYNVRKIEFPNYKSDSSILVKMYLNGEFGKNPNNISPKVASTFYAIDRYVSYKKEWENFYNNGGIIISDRYTSSNAIHQASKLNNKKEKDLFLEWLFDLEYNIYKIPIPDMICFLDMPYQNAFNLMKNRPNKINGNKEKDIHEKNISFLKQSYDNALYVANKYNWNIIHCVENNKIRNIKDINEEIYKNIAGII